MIRGIAVLLVKLDRVQCYRVFLSYRLNLTQDDYEKIFAEING